MLLKCLSQTPKCGNLLLSSSFKLSYCLKKIDFRSDTVTVPSLEMKNAMFSAEVGDDVMEEDPTVNELQRKVAKLTGKEAGLFVPSSTMGNQLALRVQLNPLQSIILDRRSHVFVYESGGKKKLRRKPTKKLNKKGVAFHSQCQSVPISPESGKNYITKNQIEENIFGKDIHYAKTTVLSLENTLNGTIFPFEEIQEIEKMARSNNLKMHLDGARLWNASVKTKISMEKYCSKFSTVNLSLAKGLGCPIGSVLVGSFENIEKAKHFRKVFGGGWRQAGYLAAAGIYAIDNNFERLSVDHENAQFLASELKIMGFELDYSVDTNMVWISTSKLGVSFEKIGKKLKEFNIETFGYQSGTRLVTHLNIDRNDISFFLEKLDSILKEELKNI